MTYQTHCMNCGHDRREHILAYPVTCDSCDCNEYVAPVETKGATIEDMVSTAGKDAIKNLPPISKREADYYETLSPRPTEGGWEERFDAVYFGRKTIGDDTKPLKDFIRGELAKKDMEVANWRLAKNYLQEQHAAELERAFENGQKDAMKFGNCEHSDKSVDAYRAELRDKIEAKIEKETYGDDGWEGYNRGLNDILSLLDDNQEPKK